jgi:hypothetical protein
MDEDYCTHCTEYRLSDGTCGCHRQLEDQSEVIDKLQEELFNRNNYASELESLLIEMNVYLLSDVDPIIIQQMMKNRLTYLGKDIL